MGEEHSLQREQQGQGAEVGVCVCVLCVRNTEVSLAGRVYFKGKVVGDGDRRVTKAKIIWCLISYRKLLTDL